MRLPSLLGSVVAIALVGTPAIGRAQHAEDPRTPTEEDRRLSAQLLDRSAVAYRLGRYEEAIAMLQDAYFLSREPVLLYNLGRAYEGAGDAQHALDAYRRYLDTGTRVPHEQAIRETISRLEQRVAYERAEAERAAAERTAAERAAADQEAPEQETAERADAERAAAERPAEHARADEARSPTEPARARPRVPVDPEPRQEPDLMPWAWTTVGVGAAGLVAGAILGGLALDRAEDTVGAPTQVDAVRALNEARDLATGANIAFAAGGIVAAAGVAWVIVELTSGPDRERPAPIEVAPTAGGATVRGTF